MSSAAVQPCVSKPNCLNARQRLAKLKMWRTDADVANAAYKRPPPARIKNPNGSYKMLVSDPKELEKAGLEASDLKIDGTNFGAVIYKEGEPPYYTAAFRGTEEWTGSDMAANYQQALDKRTNGGLTAYYRRAQEIANNMAIKANLTGSDPPKFVGHSLGGGMASAAAAATGSPATTFNAAGLNPATVIDGIKPGAEVDAVYVRGEALTSLQQLTPLPKAFGTSEPLDPSFHFGRDLLAQIGGAVVAGPWGVAGAEAVRSGLLHKMGNVTDSLDQAITGAEIDVANLCGEG